LKLNTTGPTITLPRYHIAVSFPKKRHMKRIFLFLVTNFAVLALSKSTAKRIMAVRVIAGPRHQPSGSTTF
jgi:hypothetical protein